MQWRITDAPNDKEPFAKARSMTALGKTSSLTRMPHVVACVLVISAASQAWAGRRPSFYLDYSLWKATHIVLATEGEAIDGRLTVMESWKGDLAQGAELILTELAGFADERSRQVSWRGKTQDLPEPYVDLVTGSRMVLFLVKSAQPQEGKAADKQASVWKPASYAGQDGLKVSVVWIENGETYAFQQIMNPTSRFRRN